MTWETVKRPNDVADCSGSRVLADELHDWCRVFQSVRVMTDARLANQLDLAAEFFVSLGDEAGVLVPWDDVVGVAEDVQQRHFCGGQRSEVVDRIQFPGERSASSAK